MQQDRSGDLPGKFVAQQTGPIRWSTRGELPESAGPAASPGTRRSGDTFRRPREVPGRFSTLLSTFCHRRSCRNVLPRASRRGPPRSFASRFSASNVKKSGKLKNRPLIGFANGWEPLGSETLSGIDFLFLLVSSLIGQTHPKAPRRPSPDPLKSTKNQEPSTLLSTH